MRKYLKREKTHLKIVNGNSAGSLNKTSNESLIIGELKTTIN